MSPSQVTALLMREPWFLSLKVIGRLSDWQIRNLIFRPGDPDKAKKGIYWPVANKGSRRRRRQPVRLASSFHEMVFECYRLQGIPEDQWKSRFDKRYPKYDRATGRAKIFRPQRPVVAPKQPRPLGGTWMASW